MNLNMSKIYTLATKVRENGHGESWENLYITRGGYWGDEPFPPCFANRKSAEDYLSHQEPYKGYILVELELRS